MKAKFNHFPSCNPSPQIRERISSIQLRSPAPRENLGLKMNQVKVKKMNSFLSVRYISFHIYSYSMPYFWCQVLKTQILRIFQTLTYMLCELP